VRGRWPADKAVSRNHQSKSRFHKAILDLIIARFLQRATAIFCLKRVQILHVPESPRGRSMTTIAVLTWGSDRVGVYPPHVQVAPIRSAQPVQTST
jgi:hypothetical protein